MITHLVINCYRKGKTPEEIAEFVDIPLEEVKQIIGQCQVEQDRKKDITKEKIKMWLDENFDKK